MEHKCEQGTFCVECGRDNKPTSGWEEEFEKQFPHKIAEVIDDFGSSTKTDIKAFIRKEKELSREETIALFVEWAEKNKFSDSQWGFDLVRVTDLLSYADSLKKK